MIILASASPRRRELIKMITGDKFSIAPTREVIEEFPPSLPPEEVPEFLSRLKANAYADMIAADDDCLITADTVVILDGDILGKPHNRAHAIEMLKKMQNRTHIVVTGVAIMTSKGLESFSQTTEVDFDKLSDQEIEYYVDNFRPYDKAGAYGIQEWIGAAAIKGIRGSFYNVMGLPVHALYNKLKEFNIL